MRWAKQIVLTAVISACGGSTTGKTGAPANAGADGGTGDADPWARLTSLTTAIVPRSR